VRVGGRAWTCEVPGIRVDVGCGWLNSADRIPWIRIAERPALRSIVALLPGAAVSGRRLLANGSGRREVRLRCLEQRRESAPPASDSAAHALEPIAVSRSARSLTSGPKAKSRARRESLKRLAASSSLARAPRHDLRPRLDLVYVLLENLCTPPREFRKPIPPMCARVANSITTLGFCAPILASTTLADF
jgi:phytoene dehydrogenase-like protein